MAFVARVIPHWSGLEKGKSDAGWPGRIRSVDSVRASHLVPFQAKLNPRVSEITQGVFGGPCESSQWRARQWHGRCARDSRESLPCQAQTRVRNCSGRSRGAPISDIAIAVASQEPISTTGWQPSARWRRARPMNHFRFRQTGRAQSRVAGGRPPIDVTRPCGPGVIVPDAPRSNPARHRRRPASRQAPADSRDPKAHAQTRPAFPPSAGT